MPICKGLRGGDFFKVERCRQAKSGAVKKYYPGPCQIGKRCICAVRSHRAEEAGVWGKAPKKGFIGGYYDPPINQ